MLVHLGRFRGDRAGEEAAARAFDARAALLDAQQQQLGYTAAAAAAAAAATRAAVAGRGGGAGGGGGGSSGGEHGGITGPPWSVVRRVRRPRRLNFPPDAPPSPPAAVSGAGPAGGGPIRSSSEGATPQKPAVPRAIAFTSPEPKLRAAATPLRVDDSPTSPQSPSLTSPQSPSPSSLLHETPLRAAGDPTAGNPAAGRTPALVPAPTAPTLPPIVVGRGGSNGGSGGNGSSNRDGGGSSNSGGGNSGFFYLPSGLAERLYPHQTSGVEWLAARACAREGCLLGDEMGMGKTIQVRRVIRIRSLSVIMKLRLSSFRVFLGIDFLKSPRHRKSCPRLCQPDMRAPGGAVRRWRGTARARRGAPLLPAGLGGGAQPHLWYPGGCGRRRRRRHRRGCCGGEAGGGLRVRRRSQWQQRQSHRLWRWRTIVASARRRRRGRRRRAPRARGSAPSTAEARGGPRFGGARRQNPPEHSAILLFLFVVVVAGFGCIAGAVLREWLGLRRGPRYVRPARRHGERWG